MLCLFLLRRFLILCRLHFCVVSFFITKTAFWQCWIVFIFSSSKDWDCLVFFVVAVGGVVVMSCFPCTFFWLPHEAIHKWSSKYCCNYFTSYVYLKKTLRKGQTKNKFTRKISKFWTFFASCTLFFLFQDTFSKTTDCVFLSTYQTTFFFSGKNINMSHFGFVRCFGDLISRICRRLLALMGCLEVQTQFSPTLPIGILRKTYVSTDL